MTTCEKRNLLEIITVCIKHDMFTNAEASQIVRICQDAIDRRLIEEEEET